MRAGQQMVDDHGNQVALFPLEYLYISQGENGSYSHQGILAIDFLGWGQNGRRLLCPYYAPCDCKVVYHASYYNVWESLAPVVTPNGLQYITFEVAHDDNPPPLGTTANQGDLIGHTGTNGHVTGDHLHLNSAIGHYQGFYTVSTGKRQLVNSSHIYNTFYVNDTKIKRGYGYTWKLFNGGNVPTYRKYNFKWVLYANKIRSRNV
ncbi:MAG: hypothetical protein J6S85_15460 [Methanobrevibacter sp.]|nr:hypothetical protein [Methanobrevibacter sp.]